MADLKEMRAFVDRLESSGVNDIFMERQTLSALIYCAEALGECVELLTLRGLTGECTKMGTASLAKLEQAP